MELIVNGNPVLAKPGQSLLEIVKLLDLERSDLSSRPLAAKIAGDVFTLNYIPVRTEDDGVSAPMRRAMEASGGKIELLTYEDAAGRDVYARTAQFVMFLAFRQLYPDGVAKMGCTVGPGLFVEVEKPVFSVEDLKRQMQKLVEQDIPLIRRRVDIRDAIAFFSRQGQTDKADLLRFREKDYFDAYFYEDFCDYFYGELAPSTGYLQVWDILPAPSGFVFLYPDDACPDRVAHYQEMPTFLHVCYEGKEWGERMQCETVADLNELTENGGLRELIRVNEALHEKRFSQVADQICGRGCSIVMLAGPSSSGKTTSANRLATQLQVLGKDPILMSLDDFFINRDDLIPDAEGKLDFEHINALDVPQFRSTLTDLLAGKSVELPTYNFLTGMREWHGKKLQLNPDTVVIIEGLHALNPTLLPDSISPNAVFRLYVSPLLPLNLDHHNRIPSSYLRLLRRIVRDNETRGYSVQKTLAIWDSVRQGEKRWIYPFQENADVIFNSSTLYELAVLKKHIFPLLTQVEPGEACYDAVRSIISVLEYVKEADVDDEIPPTSLVREFIGGNTFYRQ